MVPPCDASQDAMAHTIGKRTRGRKRILTLGTTCHVRRAVAIGRHSWRFTFPFIGSARGDGRTWRPIVTARKREAVDTRFALAIMQQTARLDLTLPWRTQRLWMTAHLCSSRLKRRWIAPGARMHLCRRRRIGVAILAHAACLARCLARCALKVPSTARRALCRIRCRAVAACLARNALATGIGVVVGVDVRC